MTVGRREVYPGGPEEVIVVFNSRDGAYRTADGGMIVYLSSSQARVLSEDLAEQAELCKVLP